MSKLFYGNGNCSIESNNIQMIRIVYTGAIEIDDKTPDSYFINANSKYIVIMPHKRTDMFLNNLFNYVGSLKIINVKAYSEGMFIPTTIHRVMDYSELLNTNAEDMTTNSEDLVAGYVSGKSVTKTVLKQPTIPNLQTSEPSQFYLPDGSSYNGSYHLHIRSSIAMSGAEHTDSSIELKSKRIKRAPVSKARRTNTPRRGGY